MKPIIKALSFCVFLLSIGGCTIDLQQRLDKETSLYSTGRYQELADEIEKKSANDPAYLNTKQALLCEAYSHLKKYNKLFECLEKSNKGKVKGGEGNTAWEIDAWIDLGDYKKAEEKAERLYGFMIQAEKNMAPIPENQLCKPFCSHQFMLVTPLGQLALAYALSGNRVQAMKFANELERIDVPTFPRSFLLKKALRLMRTYLALREYQLCQNLTRQIDAYQGEGYTVLGTGGAVGFIFGQKITIGGENWNLADELPVRIMTSKCALEAGEMKEAKRTFDKLLDLPQTKDQGTFNWMILYDRGRIAEMEKERKEAIDFYQRAIDLIEQQRSTINTEASKIGYVGDKQQVYYQLVAALVAEVQTAKAFEYVERSKARALVDLLVSKQNFAVPVSNSQQVASLVQEWDKLDEEKRVPAASQEQSITRSARDLEVRAKLRSIAPEVASVVMVSQIAAGEIQSMLQLNETLLEYYYQGDDLYAFVVTRDAVKAAKLNGTGLISDVQQFRTALQERQSRRFAELSQKLYGRLIKPIEPTLMNNQLLIVAHGALHYLPFSALQSDAGYLIDRYSIRHLPSASVMQFLKDRQTPKSQTVLAFGNPDLGKPEYDLKFAQDEAMAIAKGFPQAKVLVRKDATKTALKTLGPQFSYLHFATHGKFDPDAPLNSGLLLASDAQNDGFLSLGELYSLRLNADLVTLSACETGLGKISNGDDVVGLARGFLYAGSNAIVASLWEVDDAATSFLMTEFYANLKKTNKREALRQAQLAAKTKYDHPFYWAAFQLTGRAE